MHVAADPVHQATVSSELRRLLAAYRGRVSPPHDTFGPRAQATIDFLDEEAPWIPTSLRRDGARPLTFMGLLVHRTEVRAPVGTGILEIYATDVGGAVAQVTYEPTEGMAARPVFRARRIDDAGDLRSFLACEVPGLCVFDAPDGIRQAGTPAIASVPLLPTAPPGLAQPDHLRPLDCEGMHP